VAFAQTLQNLRNINRKVGGCGSSHCVNGTRANIKRPLNAEPIGTDCMTRPLLLVAVASFRNVFHVNSLDVNSFLFIKEEVLITAHVIFANDGTKESINCLVRVWESRHFSFLICSHMPPRLDHAYTPGGESAQDLWVERSNFNGVVLANVAYGMSHTR